MTWALLSLLAAFGQALAWAIKKKVLNQSGLNNFIGLISYAVAALGFLIILTLTGERPGALSARFWWSITGITLLNAVAVWSGYKAIDKGPLSLLMPFVALTALTIVPVEYLLEGTVPHPLQLLGMAVIVTGAVLVGWQKKLPPNVRKVYGYFAITLLAYSITSPLMGVAAREAGSSLIASLAMHAGIAGAMLVLFLISRERHTLSTGVRNQGGWKYMLSWLVLSGLVIALLENGPVMMALQEATASEVFALKRTMPFFALVLGAAIFKEEITARHTLGTTLLISGSVVVIWFG